MSDTHATTAVATDVPGHEVEAVAWGLSAGGWVAMSMLVVFAIMLWLGVPRIIARALDSRIDAIRKQLDEAAKLRAEAEALKQEYAAKAAAAASDADAIRAAAKDEARAIVAKGQADAEALVARRQRMAEDKIAAAERAAIADIRAKTAEAATAAAARLIAEKGDARAGKALVDAAIDRLG